MFKTPASVQNSYLKIFQANVVRLSEDYSAVKWARSETVIHALHALSYIWWCSTHCLELNMFALFLFALNDVFLIAGIHCAGSYSRNARWFGIHSVGVRWQSCTLATNTDVASWFVSCKSDAQFANHTVSTYFFNRNFFKRIQPRLTWLLCTVLPLASERWAIDKNNSSFRLRHRKDTYHVSVPISDVELFQSKTR